MYHPKNARNKIQFMTSIKTLHVRHRVAILTHLVFY
jgi:hypothetical protein